MIAGRQKGRFIMAFNKLMKKTAVFMGAAALVLSTGSFASAATTGAEVTAVSASVADTDAAVPSTAYTVTLLSSSGVAIPHANPIDGATVEYNATTNKTTITFYQTPLVVSTVHGYIDSLTLSYVDGDETKEAVGEVEEYEIGSVVETAEDGTTTTRTYEYPSVVSYELDGNHTSLPETYSISYQIAYVTATSENPSHRQSTGSIVINAETVSTDTATE